MTKAPLSGWLAEVLSRKEVQEAPGLGSQLRKEVGLRLKQEPQKPQPRAGQRANTAGHGEGSGEENGKEGWERQLGELKYADGEMCECLGERKDPEPRE